MVGTVNSFDPVAYLKFISGAKQPGTNTPYPNPNAPAANTNTPTTPTTPSKPATNLVGVSSEILSLLQGTSSQSSTGSSLSSLLGQGGSGVSSSNDLAGVYDTFLYNQTTSSPLANAVSIIQQQAKQNAAVNNTQFQRAITSYHATYNNTNKQLIAEAKAAIAANNGSLPA